MPKAAGIKLNGIKFEDALRRMLNTPPPPKPKGQAAKRPTGKKRTAD